MARPTRTANVPIPESVPIPAGEFLSGDDLESRHGGCFEICAFPTTNAQYERFVLDTGHRSPPHWPGGRVPMGAGNHPVVNVSWSDAEAYARFMGLGLPTEWQWERAARGTDGRIYPWGMDWDPSRCNSYVAGLGRTSAVDAFLSGVSPSGCYDMAGNVWELTRSETLEGHLARCGGSFLNYGITDCRCAARTYVPLDHRSKFCGFRCVVGLQ